MKKPLDGCFIDTGQEEKNRDWELDTVFATIVMLPYADWWQVLQCFGVLLSSCYATFNVTYFFYYEVNSMVVAVYYMVEVIFFFDVLLLVINRNIVVLKKKMYQKQEYALVILLCVLSIMPISEVYEIREMLMWQNSPENVRRFKIYMTTKVFLRLTKVVVYYRKKRSEAGINQLIVIFCGQVFLLILTSNLFGSLLYLTQYNVPLTKWTSEVSQYVTRITNEKGENTNNTLDTFLIFYTTMANILAHNWPGIIPTTDFYANLLILLAMILGHMFHTMVIFGLITVTFMNKQRKQIDFSTKIKTVTKFMERECRKNPLIPKTKEYYNELWKKRSGVKSMPSCFNLLPPSLQREVTVDIFWDMLEHSQLFADIDMSIKRAVSLVMKAEFMLPGDYLYRATKSKMKMVFIVSGVVQVLSDDDDDSPLLSLSSGSVLGETCLIFGSKSNSNLRSATYCELQVLYLADLYRTLLKYRSRTKILQNIIYHRIEKAKRYQKNRVHRTVKQEIKGIFEQTLDTSMRRLKKQWHKIYDLEYESIKSVSSFNLSNHNLDPTHADALICSQYLNLIVLSNEIELKVQAIFLKGNFPFVLDPDSEFNYFIEHLCLASVIAQYFVLPYYVFFGETMPSVVHCLLLLLDAIYFFDIMLQATTAVKKKNHLVTDSLAILISRFKQLSFIVDIIATLPYDVILAEISPSHTMVIYLKLPKLLKVYKLISLIKSKEQMLGHDTLCMRLLKYVIIFMCVVYFITCLLIITYPGRFYSTKIKELGLPVGLISAYYTINAYSNVGLFPRISCNMASLLIMHIVTMLSYFMYGLCFAELTSLEILLGRIEKLHKTFVTALIKYMHMRVFPVDISARLLDMVTFQWSYSNGSEFMGENSIIKEATVDIKKNIIYNRVKETMEKMYILEGMSNDIIKYIFQSARYFVFNPGAIVLKYNSRSAYMYIIIRGYCNIESAVPGDRERGLKRSIKTTGDCFPVVEVLHDVNTLIKVKTLTAVETVMLPAITFRKIMKCHPTEFEDVIKALALHELAYGSILHKLEHKVPLLNKIPQRSLGPGQYFQYTYDELKCAKDEWKVFLKPYQELGIFSMIRYFALPKTINPNGTFFKAWETSRCVFATTHFFLVIFYMNVLFYHIKVIDIVFTILNFTAYADLYVRCHCQFYDARGILVTHPLATAIYYFKHGFTLDLIGVLPFDYVYLQDMFQGTSEQSAKALLYLLTRPLQLHRMFRFVFHVFERTKISESYVFYFKSTLAVAVFLLVMSSITQLVSCWDSTTRVLHCCTRAWTSQNVGQYTYNNFVAMLTSLYLIVSLFNGSCVGSYKTHNSIDMMYVMIIVPLLAILRWVTYAKLTSKLIESENTLTKSQNDIKSYLNFVRSESITGHVVDDLVAHYEHKVMKDHNTRLASIGYRFSPQLHEDIAFYDFGRALVDSTILKDIDISIIRYLCTMFSRHFIKKDSEIIRCNDVNNRLYFIWRGKVDIKIANCKVATMGHGGMFGCLARRGYIRQTISATTAIHVELVSIKSDLFNELIERYPVVKSRVDNSLKTNVEYIPAHGVSAAIIKIKAPGSKSNFQKIRRTWHQRVNDIFDQQARWYKIFDYILNVHLAPLSCMAVLTMQVMPSELIFKADKVFLVVAAFFSLKLFLGFHLTYINSESGVTVTNKLKICKRYLAQEFLIDFVSILPIQLCSSYIDTSIQYSRLLYSNYLIRFVFLIRYYHMRKYRLNVENHLRWTFLIYVTIFSIQVMTYMWKFLACNRRGGGCSYTFGGKLQQDNGTIYSTLLAYTYMTNRFTSTGLQHVRPTTLTQIGMTTAVLILCFLLGTILSAGFATSFMVTSYAMSNFDHEIENIKYYLIGQNLSQPILQKVWTYYLQLWQRESGKWTPSVIRDAPGSLQQNLLQELYGYHLYTHVLFSNTHVDFLRQLVMHLKRFVYLPGYSIVQAGDVDNTIYFVHSGEVEILQSDPNIDFGDGEVTEGKILIKEGGSFGEEQGLFNTPHKYTYRAYTVVDILMLNYKYWRHLIPWFPASHEEIIAKAKKLFYVPINPKRHDTVQLSQA